MLPISSDDTTTDDDHLSWYVSSWSESAPAVLKIYSSSIPMAPAGNSINSEPVGDDIFHNQARLAALVELYGDLPVYQNRIQRRKKH
jgi:hypothetical protein